MAWNTPRSKLSTSNGNHERHVPTKPQKLPTMKRGSSLRVGRVVSDIRSTSTWDNQSSSPFVHEEERRVQEELVEMLMVKLANKEKEVEMLRCKQNVVDQQCAVHDRQLQQQHEEHTSVVSELTSTIQELQRQVQLLQIQCEQLQVDSDAQHTAALEQRRLREKAQAQVRLDNKAHQQIVDELRREREQSVNDRFALENKLQTILQDQQTQSTLVEELESRCAQLEDGLEHSVESCQQLREVLVHEEQKRKDVAAMWKKLEEEKLALEEKHRALIKTLKGANSRTADMEKKRSELCQVENQLREQLAALTKENSELKARRGQMSSQTKHLQARIAALESVNFVQEKKLEDAVTELESARRYCRDFQFRTKQLQEEVMFLKNRKSAAIDNPATSDVQIAAPETDANDMPCWMKD
ncbi:hypothetical protein F441_09460 [Phytophthora nicotianae CJ01A1]|uniref:Uncharacterized protein n=2 Tax=Phytophthora nicotianae TaxID=4792 RepID=W2X0E2_PHYNI|nr:hypothetical protein L916_09225 [Phytophthora nicotianae]ETP15893.1 hypothetical protein F441_09460 [Phytophthora nicotianae CJ01A1]